jgi:hypothetical protein
MTLVLAATLLLGQLSLPHLPDIPHLPNAPQIPSTIPLPPLMKAPPDSIVVQPTEKLRQIPELDNFEPGRFAALTDLPHDADGTFTLYPGAFELIDQSFCLRAGGHGPSGSSAYLVGALTGSRASYVSSVLTRWHAQPSISQGDVQSLLWAITSQTKFSALPDHMKSVAGALLTAQEIDQLDGGALGSIVDFLARSGVGLPAPLREVLTAESQVRDLLTHGNSSYQQLAALAVPAVATKSDAGRKRWSYDPRGFFVRYLPQSYSTTTIQLYVPPAYSVMRDSAGRVVRIADDRGSQLDITYLAASMARMTLSRTTLVADFGALTSRLALGAATVVPSALPSSDAQLRSIDSVARTAQFLLNARGTAAAGKADAQTFLGGAVADALCKSFGGCSGTRVAALNLVGLGPGGSGYNPSAAMGTPADGALQPLAQSGKPAAGDKNKICERVREERNFDYLYEQRYKDPELEQEAAAHDWSGQQFQDAVHDKAVRDGVGGGGGTFREGGSTDFKKCVATYPTPAEVADNGWPPISYDEIKNHEEAHVARCLKARETGEIDDWKWRQQTEIEGYERSIETLEQWMAANC